MDTNLVAYLINKNALHRLLLRRRHNKTFSVRSSLVRGWFYSSTHNQHKDEDAATPPPPPQHFQGN